MELPVISKQVLIRAQAEDRESLRQLQLVVGQCLSSTSDSLDVQIREAMIDQLKVKATPFL